MLPSDVEVVEKRSPSLVVSTIDAGKADQAVALVGENDELIRRRRGKPLLPDAEPVSKHVTIEVLIPISPAVVSPPAFGVHLGDGRRVRSGGFSRKRMMGVVLATYIRRGVRRALPRWRGVIPWRGMSRFPRDSRPLPVCSNLA